MVSATLPASRRGDGLAVSEIDAATKVGLPYWNRSIGGDQIWKSGLPGWAPGSKKGLFRRRLMRPSFFETLTSQARRFVQFATKTTGDSCLMTEKSAPIGARPRAARPESIHKPWRGLNGISVL